MNLANNLAVAATRTALDGFRARVAAAGLPESAAWDIALALLTIYTLALHWFLARCGLGISPLRAVVFVGIVNIGTGVLVIGPLLLGMAMNGPAR